MPLIIREELLNIWLNDDVTFNEFYNTYIKNDEFQLNFRKVSAKVNNVKYNNADIFEFSDEEITLF
jgi:putative SOS response-associated peptidase YedK